MAGSHLVWRGDQVKAEIHGRSARGLFKAAEFLLEQANRTVPIEEGTLMRSGQASVDEGELVASVSYGPLPYSVRQHEDLSLRHDQGRRGKWLELTAQEQAAQLARIVAETIAR